MFAAAAFPDRLLDLAMDRAPGGIESRPQRDGGRARICRARDSIRYGNAVGARADTIHHLLRRLNAAECNHRNMHRVFHFPQQDQFARIRAVLRIDRPYLNIIGAAPLGSAGLGNVPGECSHVLTFAAQKRAGIGGTVRLLRKQDAVRIALFRQLEVARYDIERAAFRQLTQTQANGEKREFIQLVLPNAQLNDMHSAFDGCFDQ